MICTDIYFQDKSSLIIFFNFCSNNIFISTDHTSLQKNKQANKKTKNKQTKQTKTMKLNKQKSTKTKQTNKQKQKAGDPSGRTLISFIHQILKNNTKHMWLLHFKHQCL